MATKKETVSAERIKAARRRAQATRDQLAHRPTPTELLTSQELADAAPFYFELRAFIAQLKGAREAADLTIAALAARTGLTVEYLSRLET